MQLQTSSSSPAWSWIKMHEVQKGHTKLHLWHRLIKNTFQHTLKKMLMNICDWITNLVISCCTVTFVEAGVLVFVCLVEPFVAIELDSKDFWLQTQLHKGPKSNQDITLICFQLKLQQLGMKLALTLGYILESRKISHVCRYLKLAIYLCQPQANLIFSETVG